MNLRSERSCRTPGECCFPPEQVFPFSSSLSLRLPLMSEALQKVVFFCRMMCAFIEKPGVGWEDKSLSSSWCYRALSLCEGDWSVCLSLFSPSLSSLPLDFPVLFFLGFKHAQRILASFHWKKYISELSWTSVFWALPRLLTEKVVLKRLTVSRQ